MKQETFVADVRQFTELAGCSTDHFNSRQSALYLGLQLEEMAEKLDAIVEAIEDIGPKDFGFGSRLHLFAKEMEFIGSKMKDGTFDAYLAASNREALLDADVDLAWVTIGAMLSQGADVLGAMGEVARANLDKFPGGFVIKDSNGKVVKPVGWRAPDLKPFVCAVESEGGETD